MGIFLIFMMLFSLAVFFWQASLLFSSVFGAPTVYANSKAIEDAYRLVDLQPGQVVLDLGCGNGNSLIIAAKKFGAKGIGVEISPYCYLKSKLNILFAGQSRNIKIYLGDLKRSERLIKEADLIYLYLLNSVLAKIENSIFDNLKKTAKIVTLSFKFDNHQPEKRVETRNLGKITTLWLYSGVNKAVIAKNWRKTS